MAMQTINTQSNPRQHTTDFHLSQEVYISLGTLFIWQDVAQPTHKTPHSDVIYLILVLVTDGGGVGGSKAGHLR